MLRIREKYGLKDNICNQVNIYSFEKKTNMTASGGQACKNGVKSRKRPVKKREKPHFLTLEVRYFHLFSKYGHRFVWLTIMNEIWIP